MKFNSDLEFLDRCWSRDYFRFLLFLNKFQCSLPSVQYALLVEYK